MKVIFVNNATCQLFNTIKKTMILIPSAPKLPSYLSPAVYDAADSTPATTTQTSPSSSESSWWKQNHIQLTTKTQFHQRRKSVHFVRVDTLWSFALNWRKDSCWEDHLFKVKGCILWLFVYRTQTAKGHTKDCWKRLSWKVCSLNHPTMLHIHSKGKEPALEGEVGTAVGFLGMVVVTANFQ